MANETSRATSLTPGATSLAPEQNSSPVAVFATTSTSIHAPEPAVAAAVDPNDNAIAAVAPASTASPLPAPASPTIKREVAAPAAAHIKHVMYDLTVEDSDDDGGAFVSAPAPAPAHGPAPVLAHAPVYLIDSDDEVVLVPPPRVRQDRVRAVNQTGGIRQSEAACKDAASMYWHLAMVIIYWMKENPGSELGSFPMEPTHIGQLHDLLAPFKTIWKDSLRPLNVHTLADRLDRASAPVREQFRTFSIRPNTLYRLFLPHTLNEVRTIWREYTANGINLQVGRPMLVSEHFEGFFPVLYKHMEI
ncbi:predicted protein [Botrytis cinerea T4]|uniref:Uncharacterized protein n=1 Tax=Botryotinia fuckeliana (strain T4) TaxID=999810 RepID=G2XP22_BOTF4|nr:predicted protein [Botrytis cinerea T4]